MLYIKAIILIPVGVIAAVGLILTATSVEVAKFVMGIGK